MQPADDSALLRQFAETRSDEAFAALVARHINLVYSVALRQAGQPQDAEEITQAVFIILAKKAAGLRHERALTSWLFQTTRLTANNFVRSELRRLRREKEAYMRSILDESAHDIWPRISPLLDNAVGSLREKDRRAILLRFYEGRNLREIGAVLGTSEDASEKRISRALEKLRKFFAKRGVNSTAATIAENISVNSVLVAPAALAKTATAMALTQGAAASISTLTLAKGALKIMAWTKAKTAVAAGVIVLFAVGTTTIAVKEYQDRRTESWEVPTVDDPVNHAFGFDLSKPQVRIKPSIYHAYKVGMTDKGLGWLPRGDGTFVRTNYNHWTTIGLGATLKDIVKDGYDAQDWQMILLTPLPKEPLYDFVSDLPHGTAQPLQQLIERKFGLTARWETMDTNVLLLKFLNANFPRLKPAKSLMYGMNITNIDAFSLFQGTSRDIKGTNVFINQTIESLIIQLRLQTVFDIPVIDDTGFANRFDCLFKNPAFWSLYPEQQAYKDALSNQLGMELVPGTAPVKMLVVEKAN